VRPAFQSGDTRTPFRAASARKPCQHGFSYPQKAARGGGLIFGRGEAFGSPVFSCQAVDSKQKIDRDLNATGGRVFLGVPAGTVGLPVFSHKVIHSLQAACVLL
jgi:hypothetical protein